MFSRHLSLPFSMEDMADPMLHRWNNFGLGIHPNELPLYSGSTPHHSGYHHWPHQRQIQQAAYQMVRPTIGKDGFQVCVDVHQFAPNEITVKTMDENNFILVTAKHEERPDEHGHISREFTRRYDLPQGFDIKDVVSQLSSDGILTIKAPPPHKGEGKMRILNIEHIGPAHLNIGNKEAAKDDGKPAKHDE